MQRWKRTLCTLGLTLALASAGCAVEDLYGDEADPAAAEEALVVEQDPSSSPEGMVDESHPQGDSLGQTLKVDQETLAGAAGHVQSANLKKSQGEAAYRSFSPHQHGDPSPWKPHVTSRTFAR